MSALAKAAQQGLQPQENTTPKKIIATLLEQRKGEIAKMLPKHLNAERLMKVAQIAATTTPALIECEIPSLIGAIGQCAQLGLEPNTILGHAYLIPFNAKKKGVNGKDEWVKNVQVVIGYKGLIDLARRSGQIERISSHEVCSNDEFDLVYGLDERLVHRPNFENRGDVIGFYAVAVFKDGGRAFEYMPIKDVHAIRDSSQGWSTAVKYKTTERNPWHTHFIEMGRKTAIRRLAKYLPLSIEFQTAVALDDKATMGQEQVFDLSGDEYSLLATSSAESGYADQRGSVEFDAIKTNILNEKTADGIDLELSLAGELSPSQIDELANIANQRKKEIGA